MSAPAARFALPLSVCLLLLAASCARAPATDPASLGEAQPAAGGPPAFQLRALERSAGECTGDAGSCARFVARYPVITGGVGLPVQEVLNASLLRLVARGAVIDEEDGAPAPETLEAAAEEFLDGWRQAQLELLHEAMGPARWSDERRMDVIYADHRVLSVELAVFSSTAGAHPSTFTHLGSYDLATGEPLVLADLLSAGADARLEELGERAFRRHRRVPEAESLEEAGFWFEEGRFYLPDNFALTGAGLTFLYNPYEVAPYVFGSTRITLPWSEVAELLRRDAPVAPAAAGAAPPPRA